MAKLSVRPLEVSDVSYIVDYWFNSTDADLERIGVDRANFGTKESFTQALTKIANTPINELRNFYLIWLIDNQPIGYNALKDIVRGDIAHLHLHMWDAQHRGKGHGAQLYCMAVLKFYELFHLKLILCEPQSSNTMPNKMLSKIGFTKWKTYFSTSSDLAKPAELNSYIIDRDIAERYLNAKI